MMVNRRCEPASGNSNGDVRILRIKFNPAFLTEATRWWIIDVLTGQQYQFSTGYNNYLNIGDTDGTPGYFHPGEGKLFKLVPVMQKGGLLAGNDLTPIL